MSRFEKNILESLQHWENYANAEIWLQRACTELDDAQFCELLKNMIQELDPKKHVVFLNKIKKRYVEVEPAAAKAKAKAKAKAEAEAAAAEAEKAIDIVPRYVCTSGSEPFDESLFDSMLRKQNINIYDLNNSEIAVIILGHSDWDDVALYQHIAKRRGRHLRIYSQEMFLYFILLKKDPYCNPDLLSKLGGNHPALQKDLLSYLRYFDSVASRSTDYRREILNDIMGTKLPIVMTMLRLEKLANNIASSVISAREQANPPLNYINLLESDLEWLKERYYNNGFSFVWPITKITPSTEPIEEIDWPNEGLLGIKGYHVGAKGLDTNSRRKILDDVMQNRLPNVISAEHMEEWNSPMTELRLKKLAQSIAAFTKNAKRRDAFSLRKAIADWESDLAWLKVRYYDNNRNLNFPWPLTKN